MGRLGGVVGSFFVAVLLVWGTSAVASASVVADWGMNEPRGATVMTDSSGNGLDGMVGSSVTTGVWTPTGLGYDFPGPSWGYNPSRLVTVPDDPRLDPGTSPYAVTIRFRTFAHDPNIVQKGQSGQTGGYWKLVLKDGWPRCHFRDASGATKAIGFVGGSTSLKVDDGLWHTLRCERTLTGVRITREYGEPNAVSRFIRGTLGRIDNSRPFSIGGKLDCATAEVGCDYFRGQIDWIRVERP